MRKLSLSSQLLISILFISFPVSFVTNAQLSPVISDIPDQEIFEGGSFEQIDLNQVVSDPDHDQSLLTWSNSSTENLTLTIQDHFATVIPLNENWNGSEQIAFIVTDPDMNADTDVAKFTVLGVNDAPVVADIPGQTIPLGGAFAPITLDDFVSDIDNTISEIVWTHSSSDKLNVNISAGHIATITSAGSWTGSETLTFTATDAADAADSDDAVFIIEQVESLPVATDDSYTVDEGGNISTPAPGVLSNDSDADGDMISAVRVTDPSHATSFSLNGDGSFTYVHDGSAVASDAFTYVADDGTGQSTAARVSITINPVNDNPVITDIPDYTINEGGDFDPVNLNEFVSDEESGDNTLNWQASGNTDLNVEINDITHVATISAPTKKWNGSETITFTVTDPQSGTDSDNATFNVLGVQEAPVAVADAYPVNEGATLNVAASGVLGNDTDGDGDPLTAHIVSGPSNSSSFTLNTNGSFTYTHNGSETITDAFTYRAYDGTAYSNTVTVTITINPVNDPPVVSDIPDQSISEGASFATINLDGYVTDPDHADNLIVWTYSGNSSLSVSISGSRVATITTPNPDWNGTETITFIATDPLSGTHNNAASFTVSAQNDPPVVSDIPNQTISEGSSFATINLDGYVTDSDNEDNEISWSFSGNSQLSVSVSPSRVATISIPYPDWFGIETITFEATDPSNAKDNDPAIFSVINVNDNPVIAGVEGSSLSYAEGSGPVQITATITVADPENTINSATVAITSNYQDDQDVLSYETAYGITGSWNSSTGILTLTGNTTPANYQSALRTVKYTNTSLSPSSLTRTVAFTVNDGSSNSNSPTRSITINNTNSAPVLSDPSSTSISFTEGGGSVQLTNTITVADDDHTNLASARVAITSGLQSTFDNLSFISSGGITGSYNNTTGELNLTGTATLNSYRNVLRSVRFNNTSEAPSTVSRTITFTVNDGISNSNDLNKTVIVTAVNDKPVLAGIEATDVDYNEGDPPVQITNTITLTDVDNPTLPSAIISISSNYQSDQDVLSFTSAYGLSATWNSALGQLVLSGSASPADFQSALRTVKYNNTSASPNTSMRTIRFVVSDGITTSDPQTRAIKVGSINGAPVLADPVSTPVAFTEGGGPVQLTSTLTVTDADNVNLSGATVSITSGFQNGFDVLSFTPSGSVTGTYNGGVLSLTGSATVAIYQTVLRSVRFDNTSEAPAVISRTITFTVSDGVTPSNSLLKTVTVTAVNDQPVASNVNITAANNNVGTTHTGTFTFTDPDGDNPGTHTYKWYRADNPLGNLPTVIPGATSVTYKPVRADGGKYIGFEVTPVDQYGLAGLPVRTAAFSYINAAPVASNASIFAPVTQTGATISGRYTYTDKESNPSGDAIFHWYRSDVNNPTPSSPGTMIGTDSTLDLHSSEAGKWVWFKINPVATSGSTPGDSVWSNIIGPIGKFTASLSGSDTFCYGAVIPVNLTITGGKSPYTAILHRAGTLAKDTTITGITLSPKIIYVKIPGTYTIVKVTDNASNEADISAALPVTVVVNAKSKALISGTASICKESGSHAPLTLSFISGSKPWTVTIRRKETPPFSDTTITGINTNIYSFSARVIGDGPTRHRVFSIIDGNGCVGDTSSGSAWLSYRLSPIAKITGTDSICPGETVNLTVSLTSGTAPWSFTYIRNGLNPVTISNINTTTYILPVTQAGTYTISSVTDPSGTGCGSGKAEIVAFVLPTATISGSATICEYTSTNLTVSLTGRSPWKFVYTRNFTLDSTVVENVLTSPRSVSVRKAGTYRLYQVIDKNGCKGTVSGSAVISITQGPEVAISGLKTAYDFNSTEIDTIIGTPAGGEFSGAGVIGNYFIPKIAGLGTHDIVYKYRTSPSTCYGYDTVVVNVLESDAIIKFEGDRNKFCQNDAPFRVTGVNLEGNLGTFQISGQTGLVDNGDNTATVYPGMLDYNKYEITYTYSKSGQYFHETAEFDLGTPPVAVFNWASECFHAGQPIDFINKSTSSFGFLTDTSYYWKITTNSGFDADSNRNITYTFPEAGVYEISLKIKNTYGCTDTTVMKFNLRPTFLLNDETSDEVGYYEDFENNPLAWQSGNSTYPVNSWQLGTPVKHDNRGFFGAASGENCWYTKITSNPAPSERSWVSSPCFDFTGMENPMLTMKIWRLFNSNRDGANVIVSADSGKTWQPVGEVGDGERWFNSHYIRGNPGGWPLGWSNDDGISNDATWVRTRHSLDYLKGKKEVQFRIAYGSSESAQNNDGIAFDEFMISRRDKMAFIEHFTNSGKDEAFKADSTLDAFMEIYGTNAINIQYHTSNPGGDPFYEVNPLIPTARQFYYGLSGAPYAVIDGGTESKYTIDYNKNSKPFDKNKVIVRSLEDAIFQVRTDAERSGNTLMAHVRVKANQSLPVLELAVRIAVIESVVEGVNGENGDTIFKNVVRAMLPDAAGTIFYRAWDNTIDQPVDETWTIENVADINKLMVVSFIQNEATHEIYNADFDTVSLGTGTDPIPDPVINPGFTVYPNPVRNVATVRFNSQTTSEITLELFNNMGRLVYSFRIPQGTSYAEIPAEEFPDGLYILRLISNQELLGISKIIISK